MATLAHNTAGDGYFFSFHGVEIVKDLVGVGIDVVFFRQIRAVAFVD